MTTTDDPFRACERLIEAFAWHVDRREYDAVLALFIADSIFERPDRVVRGAADLRTMLDARPTTMITRHLCTNIRLEEIGPDDMHGRCYITLLSAPLVDGRAGHLKVALTGVYYDRFRRVADSWRIAARRAEIAVESPAPQARP